MIAKSRHSFIIWGLATVLLTYINRGLQRLVEGILNNWTVDSKEDYLVRYFMYPDALLNILGTWLWAWVTQQKKEASFPQMEYNQDALKLNAS